MITASPSSLILSLNWSACHRMSQDQTRDCVSSKSEYSVQGPILAPLPSVLSSLVGSRTLFDGSATDDAL